MSNPILSKLLLALGLVAAALWFQGRERERPAREERWARTVWSLFVVSRPLLYAVTFHVLAQAVPSDVPRYYLPQGEAVLRGLVPYRDFHSSYGPLFPYWCAVQLWLWHDPRVFVVSAILADAATLAIGRGLLRAWLSEVQARHAELLYITCPILVINTALTGQNQSLAGLALVLALSGLARGAHTASGVALGLGVVAVKFLPLLFAPWLLLVTPGLRARRAWLTGCMTILVAGYAPLVLKGIDVLQPWQIESEELTAGNLPALIGPVLQLSPAHWDFITALVLAVLYGLCIARLREVPWAGLSALALGLLLFSKKAYPQYLVLALFPVCAVVVRTRASVRVALALFIAGSLEPSLWFRWLENASVLHAFQAGIAAPWQRWAFALAELVLLGSYGWLTAASLSAARSRHST